MTNLWKWSLPFLLLPSLAEASYTRLWRGYMGPEQTPSSFVHQLNQSLLPATGALAQSAANLQSYLPVVLPEELQRLGLPAETALLTYRSQDNYRAYRATAEGKHYGSLHFPLFDQERSKSRVPAAYSGRVRSEAAYIVTSGDPTWSEGHVFFRVLLRHDLSSSAFFARVENHINATKQAGVTNYYVLVENDFAAEYVSFSDKKASTAILQPAIDWSTPLVKERTLAVG